MQFIMYFVHLKIEHGWVTNNLAQLSVVCAVLFNFFSTLFFSFPWLVRFYFSHLHTFLSSSGLLALLPPSFTFFVLLPSDPSFPPLPSHLCHSLPSYSSSPLLHPTCIFDENENHNENYDFCCYFVYHMCLACAYS